MTVRQQRDGRSCGGGCRSRSSRGRSGGWSPNGVRGGTPGSLRWRRGVLRGCGRSSATGWRAGGWGRTTSPCYM
ncbi:elongation factor RNA polymerase II 2, isoform CRA_a [Rattus norvegicus]|uniref:Elongation factor RNA polymerase II 2, isoform CRA_a n=1 Tax=Rattus norvegicus TaxID=10116 RepID=A6I4E8_RAT|nr:elongation factor RNA polymerase II 2, isoform CRA_a [Rattus norvegicus]